MKKLVLMLCVITLVSLTSCDPVIKSVIVSKYPEQLIYIAGYDKKLNLSGCELSFNMSDGYIITHQSMDEWAKRRFSHNIDFNKTGIYVVTVNGNGGDSSFAIQVIDENYIENIKNQTFISTGCEPFVSNNIVTKYPDRLIYIVGYDTELDLTGGELTIGKKVLSMEDENERISHDIDFDVPGVYAVTVQGNKQDDKFAVQVIDENYIDGIINRKAE